MGGDIKGGGMTIYETNTQANPSLQYGEGLTVPNPSAHMELDNLTNTGTFGKLKSYDRVNSEKLILKLIKNNFYRVLFSITDQTQLNISLFTPFSEDSKNL